MDHTSTSEQAQTLLAGQEEVFYGDGEVWVTDQRIVCSGRTHYLKGLKEAQFKAYKASDRVRFLLLSVPGFILLMAMGMFYFFVMDLPTFEFVRIIVSFTLGLLVLLLVGFLAYVPFLLRIIKRQPDIYTVGLRSKFWTTNAVASLDRDYIKSLTDMMQYAINRSKGVSAMYPAMNRKALPTPVVSYGTLQVGDATYSLKDITSVKVGGLPSRFSPYFLLPLLSVVQLAGMMVSQNIQGALWLNCIISPVQMVGYIFFFLAIVQPGQVISMLILKTQNSTEYPYVTLDSNRVRGLKYQIELGIKNSKRETAR